MKAKMDPCRQVVQQMYHILEGETTESVCENLRAHLNRCESCAEQYKILEDLVSLCKKLPPEQIPEDQKHRIKQNLLKALSR